MGKEALGVAGVAGWSDCKRRELFRIALGSEGIIVVEGLQRRSVNEGNGGSPGFKADTGGVGREEVELIKSEEEDEVCCCCSSCCVRVVVGEPDLGILAEDGSGGLFAILGLTLIKLAVRVLEFDGDPA